MSTFHTTSRETGGLVITQDLADCSSCMKNVMYAIGSSIMPKLDVTIAR